MTYILNTHIATHENGIVYKAEDGEGYFANGDLHVVDGKYHFVYSDGWYLTGIKDGEPHYLGDTAAPSVSYETVEVKDEDIFKEIMSEQEMESPTDMIARIKKERGIE